MGQACALCLQSRNLGIVSTDQDRILHGAMRYVGASATTAAPRLIRFLPYQFVAGMEDQKVQFVEAVIR